MACSSCAQRSRTAAPSRTSGAFKVVSLDGECLLTSEDGLCRVFPTARAANAAALSELRGTWSWTIRNVRV